MATVFVLILIGGLLYIYLYNDLADKRYQVEQLENRIEELEVQNVELKNDLYTVTSPTNLEQLAHKRGLVLEKAPEYLNINKWVSDSSY